MTSTAIVALLLAASPYAVAEAPALAALARMPVREVTVFKDGHAFVLHEGTLPVDPSGDVILDRLPAPVLGTFWPYAAEGGAKLEAVTAGRRRVKVERTALGVRELIEANVGAEVRIDEVAMGDVAGASYDARIVAVPARGVAELEATAPAEEQPVLPIKGEVVLLQTASGTTAVRFDQIRRVSFKGDHRPAVANEEFRNLLRLHLAWPDGGRRSEAKVGMAYLQKGLRWIPSYRVEIDGQGHAQVRLQATLVNELIDLDDATLHLVVGVPTFVFKDTLDPIALQEALANLGAHFDSGARTGYALSNAAMTQVASEYRARAAPAPAGDEAPGPEVQGGEKEEDLFVFTVAHVSLKKGERMVLPVAESRIEYHDLFTLDIPILPPAELRPNVGGEQQAEMERLLRGPRAMHVLRLANRGEQPLTTAPALIVSGDRVLGQGLLSYTPKGGQADLPITTAVDIKIKKSEREVGRTPNALSYHGGSYGRVDLKGTITLKSFREAPAVLEVTRRVLGHTGQATAGGKAAMLSAFEESPFSGGQPVWWNWISWPGWWHGVNGIGRFSWTVTLAPGQSLDLDYGWHYFWP